MGANFCGPALAVGLGPEGREFDLTCIQVEEKRLEAVDIRQPTACIGAKRAYVTKATSWTLMTLPSFDLPS
jgi:hypothetical protein